MKKFKKIFLVLLILLGTLVMFTGCNNTTTGGGSEVEVDVGDVWFP